MASRKRVLTNSQIAELLARAADDSSPPLSKAYGRAARAAHLWPVTVADLVRKNVPLSTLDGVGPFLAKQIGEWFRTCPDVPERPEERRNFLTMVEAKAVLAKNPSWLKNIKGDLQMHTCWSDGEHTVEQMGEAGLMRGYQYIAITDHAKSLKIAGGIDEGQLREQAAEIAAFNQRMSKEQKDFRVLRSVELNLNPKGMGDLESKALRKLDIVIGAFHSSLRTRDDQTARYLAALSNPDIHILAHPKGRVYNYRSGLNADWKRVFAKAAEMNKAVEVDCYADRQDLDVERLTIAKKSGALVSLGTDSHHDWQLGFIELGLAALLLVGFPKGRILNFKTRTQLLAWVDEHRS
jgi:DNA polymerase (family 10)